MKSAFGMLGVLGLGLGLMYLMDPAAGPRRRRRLRNRATSVAHRAQRRAEQTRRDVAHRVSDLMHETRHQIATGVSALQGGEPMGAQGAPRSAGPAADGGDGLGFETALSEVARQARRLASPAAQFALGAAGIGLYLLAQRRGGLLALPLGLIAAGLMSRGATPRWAWGHLLPSRSRPF